MTIRKRVKLSPEVREAVHDILRDDDPDKLVRAFRYATGGVLRCAEVIESTPTRLVCLAEYLSGEDEGLVVRAEVNFDLVAGRVTSIMLQRTRTK
jgi:hypothetical protein